MRRAWGAEGRSEPSQGSAGMIGGKPDPCLSPTGRGRRRPRRRVRVSPRSVDLEPRSFVTSRPPHPALSPAGRGFRNRIDAIILRRAPSRGPHAQSGFSLLEVMISIAILAIALVVLTRTVTGDVRSTLHSRMLTAATFLARTKISALEQSILEIGFSEMEGEDSGDFTDEGFPRVKWYAAVEKVKLPTSAVQDVQQAAQQKTQSTNPMDMLAGFMGSFMTTLMDPIRIGLEESVRRVVVKVKWNEPGRPEQSFEVVNFMTDPSKLDMALMGGSPTSAPGGKSPTSNLKKGP